jgi:hypothetical protein
VNTTNGGVPAKASKTIIIKFLKSEKFPGNLKLVMETKVLEFTVKNNENTKYVIKI